jgi:hypothetical protein
MCGATLNSASACPACGEKLSPPVVRRRTQLPMLPPISGIHLIAIVAVVVALLLPLVQWLRDLLRGF